MFFSWLLDQVDEPGREYDIARIIFKDFNNGCLGVEKSFLGLTKHFVKYHPASSSRIVELLINAFDEYTDIKQKS